MPSRTVLNASIVFAIGLAALLLLAGVGRAAGSFSNGGFEVYQSYNGENWRGFPEKYGADWSVQVISEDGLHFMDSKTFTEFLVAVFGAGYNNYRLEGDYSQAFASRRGFNFVFFQTVTVNPGTDYAFGGKIVTYWKGPGGERDDTKIFKRIGLDLNGGTDYSSANVIWTDWESIDNSWTSPALAATASGPQITVFIQVDNRGGDVGATSLNSGHIDNFKFEEAPLASINMPAQAQPGSVTATWNAAIPAPSPWAVWGYDVQFKDAGSNTWQTLQTHDGNNNQNTQYSFSGEAGKTYSLRVRPWMQWGTGDAATSAMPGMWQEKSVTIGGAVNGRVTNHLGLGLDNIAVSVSGAPTSTLSTDGGQFSLPTGAGTFSVLATSTAEFVAPPTSTVTVADLSSNGSLVITMRPTGAAQALANNDFETGVDGWAIVGSAARSTLDSHTGQGSLLISGTATVSQTGSLSNTFNPALSFWYKADAPFAASILGDSGNLQALAEPTLISSTLPTATDWTFAVLDVGSPGVYSGTIGAAFSAGGGQIFIDEVALAAGPRRLFLPVVFK
ncbi:MAG: hypothetical protein Kow0031_39290 [Anaerolineae bacterium]